MHLSFGFRINEGVALDPLLSVILCAFVSYMRKHAHKNRKMMRQLSFIVCPSSLSAKCECPRQPSSLITRRYVNMPTDYPAASHRANVRS